MLRNEPSHTPRAHCRRLLLIAVTRCDIAGTFNLINLRTRNRKQSQSEDFHDRSAAGWQRVCQIGIQVTYNPE